MRVGYRQPGIAWYPVCHKWRKTTTRATAEASIGIDIDCKHTRVGVRKNGTAEVDEVTRSSRTFADDENANNDENVAIEGGHKQGIANSCYKYTRQRTTRRRISR